MRMTPLALAAALLATPATARDWSPVTDAQNALARELTGKPGPFAVPLPDSVPPTIGTIAAADLIAKGCIRVPGTPPDAAKGQAIELLRAEVSQRGMSMAISLASHGGTFSVILLAQLVQGCPASALPAPVGTDPAREARIAADAYAKGRAEALAEVRRVVEGMK